jgi:hypothetical protein
VSGPPHSPLPWKIVRSEIPYYTWIMSGDSGVVCLGFSLTDERLLLAAPQLRAVCARLVAWMESGPYVDTAMREIADAARAALAGLE